MARQWCPAGFRLQRNDRRKKTMTAIDNNNKTTRQGRLRKLLLGIDKHLGDVTSITLSGAVYTMVDLKKLIQSDIEASDASVQAKANHSSVVQLERNSHAKINPLVRLLKYFVITRYGDTQDASNTLADFGLQPRKSTKKTVATKAEAVGKTKATRTLRHTMGPKQKAKVKGATSAGAPAAPSAPQPKPTQST
jgi:hypothetical protein